MNLIKHQAHDEKNNQVALRRSSLTSLVVIVTVIMHVEVTKRTEHTVVFLSVDKNRCDVNNVAANRETNYTAPVIPLFVKASMLHHTYKGH